MFDTSFNRRHFMQGVAGAALAAGAPVARAQAQGLKKVRYITPFGFILGFSEILYGQTGGFFAKEGLDVDIEGGRGSAAAVQQVLAGNALFSRTGGTDLIKAYAKDPSIVAFGDCYPRDIFWVISDKDKPVMSPADMVGKTIGVVSPGGATENIIDMMLAAKNIPAAEVKRETVGNAPSAFEFVKRGRVAAFIATNDTLFQLQEDKQSAVGFSTDDFAPCPGQVYMTSKALMEKEKDTLAKILRGAYAASGAMIQARSNIQPVLESMLTKFELAETKRPDKGVAVMQFDIDKVFTKPYERKFALDPASFASAYELMVKAKLVPELQDRNFFDNSAVKLAFG